jgi:hypothetical protein
VGAVIRFRERWWLALALLILAPILAAFLGSGCRVKCGLSPTPRLELSPPALMFLSALPWVLAGGLLGLLPAVIIGAVSGMLLAVFETHSPFTPLEIAGLALLFSALPCAKITAPSFIAFCVIQLGRGWR